MSEVHKELESTDDIHKAFETKDRNVFFFVHEGFIPPPAVENAKRFTDTTDAYSLNVSKLPSAKEHLKIEKLPTAIVFRNGEEVKRVDEMNPQAMKGIEDVLKA
ncbi:hypothetical protein K491DRAFT_687298 [Lophiostoma macrostomum CBS 122681]|uniref:Thioredoxin domain-containing protein n=1 Tax=Lophiostoma macrostomum CBS 122681 TaxID=1314788 RepID=A0A6A6TNX6_9PLEO|nr:hypothetical protein K491DRAFT_687298 [Lophiostoma macrostomum CBS 122681]